VLRSTTKARAAWKQIKTERKQSNTIKKALTKGERDGSLQRQKNSQKKVISSPSSSKGVGEEGILSKPQLTRKGDKFPGLQKRGRKRQLRRAKIKGRHSARVGQESRRRREIGMDGRIGE